VGYVLPEVVVQLKGSGHCDSNKVKNIIDNLMHLAYYEVGVTVYLALYEHNNPTEDEFWYRSFPNH
jgi:hypothetical protein